MKTIEITAGIIAIISLILKFFFVPFAGLILFISILLLSLLYFPLGFAHLSQIRLKNVFYIKSYKEKSKTRIFGASITGVLLFFICTGILFKLTLNPFAEILLTTGVIFILIPLIISLTKNTKRKDLFYSAIIKRIVIIGVIGLFMIIIPKTTIVKIQYRNYPDYIKAYEAYYKNPQNEDLLLKLEKEEQKIFNTKNQ